MIQIEIPDNILTFIECILPLSAFFIVAFFACDMLNKDKSIVQFLTGDLEEE
jgi:hypothetical protein